MVTQLIVTNEALAKCSKQLLQQAKNSCTDAERLLFIISEALAQDIELPSTLRLWLAAALKDISHGGNAEQALGVVRKQGQRRNAVTKNTLLAASVALERATEKTLEKAIVAVAKRWRGVSEDTVKAAWRDYGKNIELTQNGDGAIFVERQKPRVSK